MKLTRTVFSFQRVSISTFHRGNRGLTPISLHNTHCAGFVIGSSAVTSGRLELWNWTLALSSNAVMKHPQNFDGRLSSLPHA